MNSFEKQEKVQSKIWCVVWCVLIVAVALGVYFEVLNWGAWLLPGVYAIPFIIGMVYGWWNSLRYRGQRLTDKTMQNDKSAREIFWEIALENGLQPTKTDDNAFRISYQGEYFDIYHNNHRFVLIVDAFWGRINADDPTLLQLKESINNVNSKYGLTIVLSPPYEDNMIYLHSSYEIMLHPSCPENNIYIKSSLDRFFGIQEAIRQEFKHICKD